MHERSSPPRSAYRAKNELGKNGAFFVDFTLQFSGQKAHKIKTLHFLSKPCESHIMQKIWVYGITEENPMANYTDLPAHLQDGGAANHSGTAYSDPLIVQKKMTQEKYRHFSLILRCSFPAGKRAE